jgi:hypothetical protein
MASDFHSCKSALDLRCRRCYRFFVFVVAVVDLTPPFPKEVRCCRQLFCSVQTQRPDHAELVRSDFGSC